MGHIVLACVHLCVRLSIPQNFFYDKRGNLVSYGRMSSSFFFFFQIKIIRIQMGLKKCIYVMLNHLFTVPRSHRTIAHVDVKSKIKLPSLFYFQYTVYLLSYPINYFCREVFN